MIFVRFAIGVMKTDNTALSSGEVHPLPLSYYTKQQIASRSTFWRWSKEGLRILRVGGRTYLSPSELTRFMLEKDELTGGTEGHLSPTKKGGRV